MRLLKSPEVYFIGSRFAATLADMDADDWSRDRGRMGHILESFVVQQLVAQAAWLDPDLSFWHYRDKDGVEADAVITRGRRAWGVEIKAATSVGPDDGRGLARLADRCGSDFERGILLYNGQSIVPLRDKRMLAVPFSELWER